MQVITNNHKIDLIAHADLTVEERDDFSYVMTSDVFTPGDEYSPRFFRYRGLVYDTNEFTRCNQPGACDGADEFSRWDGYQSDSRLSGVLIRYAPDSHHEQIVAATYV